MRKVRERMNVTKQPLAKNRKTQVAKQPFTNAQRVTIALAIISLIGVTVTPFFGYLEKLGKSESPNNQTDALLALNDHHRAESERSLAAI
jgi:hypothetical protein